MKTKLFFGLLVLSLFLISGCEDREKTISEISEEIEEKNRAYNNGYKEGLKDCQESIKEINLDGFEIKKIEIEPFEDLDIRKYDGRFINWDTQEEICKNYLSLRFPEQAEYIRPLELNIFETGSFFIQNRFNQKVEIEFICGKENYELSYTEAKN